MKKSILILCLVICNLTSFSQAKETITDSRDGEKYTIVNIGKYTWMSENLRYNSDSSIFWQGDSLNIKYGKLYKVSKRQTVCPDGWHVPTSKEFLDLLDNISGKILDENGFHAVVKLPKKNGKFPLLYDPVSFLGASEDWLLCLNASQDWVFLGSKPYNKWHSLNSYSFVRCVKN
jgi:hypothetical protein